MISGRKIVVTAAGGFIGSHLVDELLSRNAEVPAFIHYNSLNKLGMQEGRYDDSNVGLNVIL